MSDHLSRIAATALATLALSSLAAVAQAGSVTFQWVQSSGTAASGTLTLTSAALTASDASGAAQFSLTSANLPAGETLLGDVSAFSFTMGSDTLTSINANSSGWNDSGTPIDVLESTWSAGKTFANGSILQVVGNSTPSSYGSLVTATMGTETATGQWKLMAPVPLPASVWLMLAGAIPLLAMARKRPLIS